MILPPLFAILFVTYHQRNALVERWRADTQQLAQLSPELAKWAAYDAFGRIFGRAGLSLLERESVVMGTLLAQGAPQIAVHYKALLRVG
jgi:hypothetical protein